MKIAFTGASGTGKTTLAQALAKEFGLPLNPVGARSVALSMGFDSPYEIDRAGRRGEFQKRLLDSKIEWETKNTSFVTDRSTLDNLAYDTLHNPLASNSSMIQIAKDHAKTYTRTFFCPIAQYCDLSDSVRIGNMAYQEMYEALLVGLHQQFQVSLSYVPFRELAKRISLVLDMSKVDQEREIARAGLKTT